MVRPRRAKGAQKWNGRYGLAQEASEDESELAALSELFQDDVWGTAKGIERLKRHPEFGRWMSRSDLSAEDVNHVESRLALYRDLRSLDPTGFWKLISEQHEDECLPCGLPLLVAEYLLNTVATAVLCLLFAYSTAQTVRVALAVLLLCNASCWLQSTSLFGSLAGLWWEDTQWSYKIEWQKSLQANVFEVVYCITTLGLGCLVSLGLRSRKSGQNLSEQLLGIRLIREIRRPIGPPALQKLQADFVAETAPATSVRITRSRTKAS